MSTLRILNELPGRIIDVAPDGTIWGGRNYQVFSWRSDGKITPIVSAPVQGVRKYAGHCRLLCRLLRYEIRGFAFLTDKTRIAATRQGVYFGEPADILLRPATVHAGDTPVKPPMTVTVDSEDRVLWGEYWGNKDRGQVRLFVSRDKGRTYEPFWTFQPGDIKHVHNILEDPFEHCFWVFVGDHGSEPGIGRLSWNLKQLDWLVRGEQKYRAVSAFIFPDRLVYATDTEMDYNGVYCVNKKTAATEKLADMPGSSIYSCRFGPWYVVSTSVEYFRKFQNNIATLWVSRDAVGWEKIYQAVKDIWSLKYFQFGSIVLPRVPTESDQIVFSGQALRKIDNRILIGRIE